MNAHAWSVRLTWVLDVLALSALAGTQEVRVELFAFVGILFFLSRILRKGAGEARAPLLPERVVLTVMVAVLLGVIGGWLRYRFHPIVGASYAAPIVDALLWFAPDTGRYRGWRLGIGFVLLILASALAPDAYLFAAIFAFVLLGAIAVSCGFLDEELRRRAPEVRGDPLPPGYIARSLSLAFLIFLSSVLIFPILPRINMEGRGYSDRFKVGYTEQVELGEKRGLNGKEGTGEPILRLYSQDGSDLSTDVFLGLIRGRSLDYFDGLHWSASPRRLQVRGAFFPKPSEWSDAIHVDAVRGSMPSTTLPVPYGAIQVSMGSGVADTPFPRTVDGGWVDGSSTNAGTHYSFAFFPFQKTLHRSAREEDPPSPGDTRVPDSLRTERMERLEKAIFSGAVTEAEKVDRLSGFLVRERFSASLSDLGGGSGLQPGLNRSIFERMNPIERFLFVTKEGHCELFASSSAVLLRMAGVPARLVAGFRIAKGAVGGVLTLTTNDAHAWVEYWVPGRGWTAFDPTPRILRPPSLVNYFRDGYEWVSAYWYRYVLNFTDKRGKRDEAMTQSVPGSEGSSRLKAFRDELVAFSNAHRSEMVFGLLGALILSALIYLYIRWRYPWVFSIRYRVREGSASVRRERIRMERLLLLKLKESSVEQAILKLEQLQRGEALEVLREWKKCYEQLRFGRRSEIPTPKNLADLRARFKLVPYRGDKI